LSCGAHLLGRGQDVEIVPAKESVSTKRGLMFHMAATRAIGSAKLLERDARGMFSAFGLVIREANSNAIS
jgi:hypothetical protein